MIKNLTLCCKQFKRILTGHPFVVLADSMYRLAQVKDEEVPLLLKSLYEPKKDWIWNKLTPEQASILKELDPQGIGLGRFIEHSSFLLFYDQNVLTQILEYMAWVISISSQK